MHLEKQVKEKIRNWSLIVGFGLLSGLGVELVAESVSDLPSRPLLNSLNNASLDPLNAPKPPANVYEALHIPVQFSQRLN